MTAATPEQIVVRIRLFAILRERAGCDSLTLLLPGDATVADALRSLCGQQPLGELLRRLPVQMAVNREYATPTTALRTDDELALIPPVSGGGGPQGAAAEACDVHVRVSAQPPSLDRLTRAVGDRRAGAIVIFQGVTREVDRLEYEAYVEMAEQRIERILRECIATHGLLRAAAEHRVGSVALGQASVAVAASAAHRAEAFAGARAAIDRIKAEAPIWKREHARGRRPRWLPGSSPPAPDRSTSARTVRAGTAARKARSR